MTDVPPWDGMEVARPTMEMQASAPAATVLAALADGLASCRYRVGRKKPDGFTARYVHLFDLAAGQWLLTRVDVVVLDENQEGCTLRVTARQHGDSTQKKYAARGLSAGIGALRIQGVLVTHTPWRMYPDREG